jgi:hypothetical protein
MAAATAALSKISGSPTSVVNNSNDDALVSVLVVNRPLREHVSNYDVEKYRVMWRGDTCTLSDYGQTATAFCSRLS